MLQLVAALLPPLVRLGLVPPSSIPLPSPQARPMREYRRRSAPHVVFHDPIVRNPCGSRHETIDVTELLVGDVLHSFEMRRPDRGGARAMTSDITAVPGFLFFDHVAISDQTGGAGGARGGVQGPRVHRTAPRRRARGRPGARGAAAGGRRPEPGAAAGAADARFAGVEAAGTERRPRRARARGAARG